MSKVPDYSKYSDAQLVALAYGTVKTCQSADDMTKAGMLMASAGYLANLTLEFAHRMVQANTDPQFARDLKQLIEIVNSETQ